MKEPQLHKRKLFLSDITTASSSRMNFSLSDTLAVVPATNAIQSGANTSPSENWLDDLFSAVPEPPCEQKLYTENISVSAHARLYHQLEYWYVKFTSWLFCTYRSSEIFLHSTTNYVMQL